MAVDTDNRTFNTVWTGSHIRHFPSKCLCLCFSLNDPKDHEKEGKQTWNPTRHVEMTTSGKTSRQIKGLETRLWSCFRKLEIISGADKRECFFQTFINEANNRLLSLNFKIPVGDTFFSGSTGCYYPLNTRLLEPII